MKKALSFSGLKRFLVISIALCCVLYIRGNLSSSAQSNVRNKQLDELDLNPQYNVRNKQLDELDLNPHPAWCPFATCHNSPMCKPCEQRFLIIIATGRSGSTTLSKMMKRLPSVRMAGENKNELFVAYKMIRNLRKTGHFDYESDQYGEWFHNPIPDGSFACPVQSFFKAMIPPNPSKMRFSPNYAESDKRRILGFKTIRFHKMFHKSPTWSVKKAVEFFREIFPCARVLVNIRSDVRSQVLSRKKTFDLKYSLTKIERILKEENRHLQSVAKEFGEQARLLDMSSWSDQDGGLKELNDVLKWLGFKHCAFKHLIHENAGGYARDNASVGLEPECHYRGN